MHEIKDLSNFFIYGNDDTYIMKDVKPEDFFEGTMPKYRLKNKFYNVKYDNQHIRMCKRMLRLVTDELGLEKYPDNFYCTPMHC